MCQDAAFDEAESNLVLGPIHKERWIYSCSKQLLDRVIYAYGAHQDLSFTLFRPFNWIGPRQDNILDAAAGSSRELTQFISNVIHGRDIQIVDGGAQQRSFTYIDDGISALMKIIENKNDGAKNRIFNVGNPANNFSVKELADMVVRIMGSYPAFAGRANNTKIINANADNPYNGSGYQDVKARVPTASIESERRKRHVRPVWVVLILFSVVKTKIVHYSSLCYFPLTYLAALRLAHIWEKGVPFGPSRYALGMLGNFIAVVVIAVPFLGMCPHLLRPLLSADPFALGNLEAVVRWTGWEALAGVLLTSALLAAHILHGASHYRASLLVTFVGSAHFVTATLYAFIGRIEAYSQRAAIEFFMARQGERCHVATKDYKSYAPWFYGRTTEPTPPEEVLFHGPIDQPVYLSSKVTGVASVEALGTFKETGRRNGFVFYRRDP